MSKSGVIYCCLTYEVGAVYKLDKTVIVGFCVRKNIKMEDYIPVHKKHGTLVVDLFTGKYQIRFAVDKYSNNLIRYVLGSFSLLRMGVYSS